MNISTFLSTSMVVAIAMDDVQFEEFLPPDHAATPPSSILTSMASLPSKSAARSITHRQSKWGWIEPRATRRRGRQKSLAWDHGDEYVRGNESVWRCRHCHKIIELPQDRSTSSACRHLRKFHSQAIAGAGRALSSSKRRRQDESLEEEEAEEEEEDADIAAGPLMQYISSVKAEKFQALTMRWLVIEHMPFSVVDSDSFRDMIKELNPSLANYLGQRMSVKRWIEDEYQYAKQQVKASLWTSLSKIHISFDLWSSPNGYALLAVVAHFLNTEYKVVAILLSLRQLNGAHSGENIAEILQEVLDDYSIVENLGVFVCDNASNNDTAIAAILNDDNIGSRRGRCLGHTLNLAAKAFLFGRDVEAFEKVADALDDMKLQLSETEILKAQDEWRTKGAVGKLHNIIVFIRKNPQRRSAFRRLLVGDMDVNDLEAILDNSTRWNSAYASIDRALKIKERIRLFCSDYSEDLTKDTLSDSDWQHLSDIHAALQPFHGATLRCEGIAKQGHHGAAWEVLPILNIILSHLEEGLRANNAAYVFDKNALSAKRKLSPLAVCYQNAWVKLNEYYSKTDDAYEIYASAVLYHPAFRKQYFIDQWTSDGEKAAIEPMIRTIRDQWSNNYRAKIAATSLPTASTKKLDILERAFTKSCVNSDNEFDDYIEGGKTSFPEGLPTNADIITWWRLSPFAQLRQHAYDVLTIPSMSSEVERVFSSAKILITDRRNRLKGETIEMLELLRDWWRKDIVQQRGRC